jgi:aminoglycoside 6'-N-acetyltransferase
VIAYEFEPIRTERLELRLMTADDVDSVHAWMSDPEVVEYMLYEPRTREVVAEKVDEYSKATHLEKPDDYVQPAIVLDGVVIGSIYFKIESVDDLTAEIGWALRREFQGAGYAFEAASAMVQLGFDDLGLHRIFAELDPRNAASVALCKRLGMREEALFIENMMFKGDWADTGIYAILDREWNAADRL